MNEQNPVILRERRLKFPPLTISYTQTVNKSTQNLVAGAKSVPEHIWSHQSFWSYWRLTTVQLLQELALFFMTLFLWQIEDNESSHSEDFEKIPPAGSDLIADNLGSSTPNTLFTGMSVTSIDDRVSNTSGADELLIVVEERISDNPDVSGDVFSKLVRQYTRRISEEPILFEEAQYGTVLGKQGLGSLETILPSANLEDRNLRRDLVESEPSLLDMVDLSDYNKMVAKFYIPRAPRTPYSLVDSLLSSLNISKPVDQARELVRSERESSALAIKTLTGDQQTKVNKIWRALNQQMIVSSAFQIDITVRDMQTLCDGQWLNDNVIDFYLNLISLKLNVYCWTTHFFLTLELKGYQGVARWAKRRKLKILEQRKILTPINIMGTHWALAVINSDKKAFEYYDSLLSNGNKRALKILQNYMIEEGKKQGSQEDYSQYKIVPLMDTPQQLNGYDCGVFTCTLAFFVSRDQPLQFGQPDMKTLRRKMAYEILSKELLA